MFDDILIKDWPGLEAEAAKKIEACYVHTLRQFLAFSEESEGLERLHEEGLADERIASLRDEAQRLLDALPEVTIRGVLDPYFETGTEGVIWSVYEDGKTGYEGLHQLCGLEHLRIVDERGTVRFEGSIVPDDKKGWQEYHGRPGEGYGQPVALGMWIRWTQKGWEPDDWAQLFVDRLPATLTYNKKRD